MAYAFDCDPDTIREWARDGLLIKTERGRYDPVESMRRYVQVRERAFKARQIDGIDASTENALMRRAQRRMIEMKQAELDGTLISLEQVEEAQAGQARAIRAMVLAIPNELEIELPHMTGDDKTKAREVCERILKAAAAAGHKTIAKKVAPVVTES